LTDIADFENLRDRDLRREGVFVAEGRLLVERSVSAGLEVLSVYAAASAAVEAAALAGEAIPLSILDDASLERVAGYPFHRGIFAVVRRPESALPFSSDSPELSTARVLVLPSITDPGNLGTLLRSALAFGFSTVYLGAQSCDPFNRKALRASMGAALTLRLCPACPADLSVFSARGGTVYAAAMEENALDASMVSVRSPCALVLGNEHDGIPGDWRRECDTAVVIPVGKDVDSLNVAIAGSILMWHLSGSTV
jgi:tRNA G18 (ribose-2'-O)-methylase SpoU